MSTIMYPMEKCPCGSNNDYAICCAPYHTGSALPSTPEQLMRSRYTAYYLNDISYIMNTMQGAALNDFDPEEAKRWASQVTWLGLKVLKSNMHDDKGFVEFIASFLENNKKRKIHELSLFQKIQGKWLYVDGKNRSSIKK